VCDEGTAAECCECLEKEDGVDRVVEMRGWKVCCWMAGSGRWRTVRMEFLCAIYIIPVIHSRMGSLGIDCDLKMSASSSKVMRWSTSGSLRKEVRTEAA